MIEENVRPKTKSLEGKMREQQEPSHENFTVIVQQQNILQTIISWTVMIGYGIGMIVYGVGLIGYELARRIGQRTSPSIDRLGTSIRNVLKQSIEPWHKKQRARKLDSILAQYGFTRKRIRFARRETNEQFAERALPQLFQSDPKGRQAAIMLMAGVDINNKNVEFDESARRYAHYVSSHSIPTLEEAQNMSTGQIWNALCESKTH